MPLLQTTTDQLKFTKFSYSTSSKINNLVAILHIIFVKTRKEIGDKWIHSEQCVARGTCWTRFDVIQRVILKNADNDN